MQDGSTVGKRITEVAGLDLGDRHAQLCVVSRASGEIEEESRVRTTEDGIRRRFEGIARMRIAVEGGTHSPWVSRLLTELGHEVVVANARKLRLIYKNRKKSDKVDAEYLARLARVDPKLLHPFEHRGEEAQVGLSVLGSRDSLVKARTQLINRVRGSVKSLGQRLPKCSAEAFAKKVEGEIPEALAAALMPLLEVISALNGKIKDYDRQIDRMIRESFPQAQLALQVPGVGPLTALAYVLVLEDPCRFVKSRTVGAYLGLVPARDDSGESSPELRITKEGNVLLRRLLVQCGHYILGPFGEDCDLRRYGDRVASRGGKNAKKRAAVAVARKLAVMLHRLWRNGEVYDRWHNAKQEQRRRRRKQTVQRREMAVVAASGQG